MNEQPGIALLSPIGDKWGAEILFDGHLEPIEFFRRAKSRDEMLAWIVVEFLGVRAVVQKTWNAELDFIALFGARMDHDGAEGERLSTNQILRTLDEADAMLDIMEKKTNAVLPSPLVED